MPQKNIPDPERIVREHGRMVSSICRRMIRDSEKARDAAQEVWIEVLRSLPDFRGDSKLSTYIYSIASRVILRFCKSERVYSTRFLSHFFQDGDQREFPDSCSEEKDLWVREMCDRCLTGILHCLDSRNRLAYIFRDMAELEYGEIAAMLEVDECNVRKMVSRSRARLNRFLKRECALANPGAPCRCRMRECVERVDLPDAYRNLRATLGKVSVFRISQQKLPSFNYWKEMPLIGTSA